MTSIDKRLINVGLLILLATTCQALNMNKMIKMLLKKQTRVDDPLKINRAVVKKMLDHPINLGIVYSSSCLKLRQSKQEELESDPQVRALVDVLETDEEERSLKGSVKNKLQTLCQGFEDSQSAKKLFRKNKPAYKISVTPGMLLNFGCQSLKSVRDVTEKTGEEVLDRQVRLLLKLTDGVGEDGNVIPVDDIETVADDDDSFEIKRPQLGKSFIELCDAMDMTGVALSTKDRTKVSSGALYQPITGKDVFRVACSRVFKPVSRPARSLPDTKDPALKQLLRKILRQDDDDDDDDDEVSAVNPVNEALKGFCRSLFRKQRQ